MSEVGHKAPIRPILAPADLDTLGRQHVQLMAEVWILRDRLKLLESVLVSAGLLKAGQLDDSVPDEALRQTLTQDRDAFVERIMGVEPQDRTVDRLKSHGR
jgi:hypothetical protein